MTRRIRQALVAVGARLKRQRKHLVYELPNGKNVVIASTPSDVRAENNALRDIQKAVGIERLKVERVVKERRDKPGRREAAWSRPVLATALEQSGPIAAHYIDRIAALEQDNKGLAERGDRWCAAAGQIDGELSALRSTRWVRLGQWLRLVERGR